jgi:hypothetical protein
MIKKLTKDDKQETRGGATWFDWDWCVLKCGLYCGDKEGSDDAMSDANDEIYNAEY